MIALLKLVLILTLTIVLLMRKWDLGLVLLIDTALVSILFLYPPLATLTSMLQGIIARDTLYLTGAVFLMLLLAELLRQTQSMEKMVAALQQVIPDNRVVLALIPAVIGLMPMLGGAMFSAPMVNGLGERLKLSPARRTFVNYWFRHAMEYIWPLYTSVLIAASLLGITPLVFIGTSFPLSLAALLGGSLLGLAGIPRHASADNGQDRHTAWRALLTSTWPLLLVILLVVVFKLHMLLGLLCVIVLFALVQRIGPSQWASILKRCLPLRTFSSILGVMIFKRVMEDAGAVEAIPAALNGLGLPPLLVAFFVPHLIGLLTGTPPAAIALSIPLVAPVMEASTFDPVAGGVWVFAGAFSGILMSPLHLCLALTREYFGANWGRLYRFIVPATALIIAVALGIVIWKSGA